MDRTDATAMSDYGKSILDSIPSENSLLISHTDLDWNSVRYLRSCEGVKPNIVHVSAQVMPYPWFQRQVESGMYGQTKFPRILPGISTNKLDEGNAVHLSRFMSANMDIYGGKGGIYIDMQAINDAEIEGGGMWREFLLIPHGLVYKVVRRMALEDSVKFHEASAQQLLTLSEQFTPPRINKYPSGSWEFAASSVYNDAFYQTGLTFLTFALDIEKSVQQGKMELLDAYITSLFRSANALEIVANRYEDDCREKEGGSMLKNDFKVDECGRLTYSEHDMLKNSALSHMKTVLGLQVYLKVVTDKNMQRYGETDVKVISKKAKVIVKRFMKKFKEDGAAKVFKNFLDGLK